MSSSGRAVPSLDARLRRRQRLRNVLQGLLLLVGMASMAGLVAWVVAGPGGLVWVAVLTAIALLWRPRVSPRALLRFYGARPIPAAALPGLHQLVAELSRRAGLPAAVALYHVRSRMLNAFAVGTRDEPAIAVTDGLLRSLPGRELAGVLAHEVSHLATNDTKVMTLADVVGRITHGLAYAGLLLVVLGLPSFAAGSPDVLLVAAVLVAVPTVMTLLQLALSRTREYDADLEAVRLTGDPEGLAAALQRLEAGEGSIWERIVVPHRRTPDPLLLRTHPPTAERVRRLRALAPGTPRLAVPDDLGHPGGSPPRPVRLRFPGIRW